MSVWQDKVRRFDNLSNRIASADGLKLGIFGFLTEAARIVALTPLTMALRTSRIPMSLAKCKEFIMAKARN
jgi:hypothetical protein